MDLATLERRLDSRNFYITLDIFAADMNRIFNNSKAGIFFSSFLLWLAAFVADMEGIFNNIKAS